ncbi:MAG TPA: DUF1573 domain-containing protein [Chitinophagaceae bacterium]|nr:DUF1573 domain-containing protein [Chitinophagaceae bacterium]
MKNIIIVFTSALLLIACQDNDKKAKGTSSDSLVAAERAKALTDSANFTTLVWIDSTTKDLGKMNKGESLEISFRFKNTGTKNLIIESVSAQCGCTIPEKPEEPIAPGQEGIIKAKYNGSGSGTISKQIYVRANTSPSVDHTLTFRGEMQEK